MLRACGLEGMNEQEQTAWRRTRAPAALRQNKIVLKQKFIYLHYEMHAAFIYSAAVIKYNELYAASDFRRRYRIFRK